MTPYSQIACIEATRTIGHAPLTVSFDASCSSVDGVSPPASGTFTYVWNFDDGVQTTGITVEHTFVNPGTYGVQVGLVDSGGVPVAASVRTVTVLPTQ